MFFSASLNGDAHGVNGIADRVGGRFWPFRSGGPPALAMWTSPNSQMVPEGIDQRGDSATLIGIAAGLVVSRVEQHRVGSGGFPPPRSRNQHPFTPGSARPQAGPARAAPSAY